MQSHYNLSRSAFYVECNYFWDFCRGIRTLGNCRSSLIRLTATARRTLQTIKPVASVRGCLYIWYRNDFHSGISFVPEWSLFCIHMVKSKGSERGFRSRGFRARSCATRSRYSYRFAIFNAERSSCWVDMIPKWNFAPEREFHSEWKLEWTHSGTICTVAKCRFGIMWRNTEKCMEMEWTLSRIKVIPSLVPCR